MYPNFCQLTCLCSLVILSLLTYLHFYPFNISQTSVRMFRQPPPIGPAEPTTYSTASSTSTLSTTSSSYSSTTSRSSRIKVMRWERGSTLTSPWWRCWSSPTAGRAPPSWGTSSPSPPPPPITSSLSGDSTSSVGSDWTTQRSSLFWRLSSEDCWTVARASITGHVLNMRYCNEIIFVSLSTVCTV